MLAFNQWVRRNAAATTPPMELLDTTGRGVQYGVAKVEAWILSNLV
jgi:hypothetical protein